MAERDELHEERFEDIAAFRIFQILIFRTESVVRKLVLVEFFPIYGNYDNT